MRFGHAFLVGCLLEATLAQSAPMDYRLEKTHVDLLFTIDHLGFSGKHGSFRDLDATLTCDPQALESCRVEAVVKTTSIDTGFEARDNDLRSDKFLNVAQFPEMRFASRKITRNGTNSLRIEGDLTLHGVTKPLILDATLNKVGPNPFDQRPTLGFSAHGTLKRSDFGITALLPFIGDEVRITIDAEFNRPKEG
jgi:polyisoprenoid-binding protein YceI